MKSYIFQISENTVPFNTEYVYVKASEKAIEERKYLGGFLRFNSACYTEAENCPDMLLNGNKIMTLKQFDTWINEH